MIRWYVSGLLDGIKNLIYAIFHSVAGIIFLGALMIVGQFILIFVLFNRFEASMAKEIREASTASDKIKQNLQFLHQDTGELREALGLPNRDFPSLDSSLDEDDKAEDEETNRNNVSFYKAVEKLLRHGEKSKLEKDFWLLLDGGEIALFFKRNGMTLRKTGNGAVAEKNQKNYFTFSLTSKSPKYEIKTTQGKSFIFEGKVHELLQFLEKETPVLTSHFLELTAKKNYLQELLQTKDVQEKLKGKNLVANPPVDTQDSITYSIVLKKERSNTRVRIGVDKKEGLFFVQEGRYGKQDDFRKAVMTALTDVDLRTQNEQRIEDLKKQLLSLAEDKSFKTFLESKKLRSSSTFREDGEYFYFDFLDEKGKKKGSFGIHKLRPEIYLMDEDDVSLGALKTINLSSVGDSKKKQGSTDIPRLTNFNKNDFSRTFLLVGSHENLADTIILANINEKKKSITLISVPRDLYYKGRKINTLYPLYGGERLSSELAKITGLTIYKYMVIDMYAFIDAVNILGGVDITLDEDLIDPTYRIKDGGRWSTLYYKAGSYHLNGIETLRIARSRHFSSDFGRAKRQQGIIESIKSKASSLGITDIGKVYDLVKLLQKYVDTNMSTIEIANSIMKYGNMRISSQYVLDTSNVLFHSYTNLLNKNVKEEDLDKSFDKGAYILLPKDGDWNYFRRYISSLVEGSQ